MATCGLSLARRGVVAVVVDDRGAAVGTPVTAATTLDAAAAMFARVAARHGPDCAFVTTDDVLVVAPDLAQALAHQTTRVFVVSAGVVEGVRSLVGSARAPPKWRAMLLARLPLCPPLRDRLRPMRLQLELL